MSKKGSKRNDWNWHHRKPKVLGGSGRIEGPNMVHVKICKHRAWHILFETSTPQEIARIINKTWIDPDWELIPVKRIP
jgi:hypothetical protein